MRRQRQRQLISKPATRQLTRAMKTLFPNVDVTVGSDNKPELWVKDSSGYGFAISFNSGCAGVSATIRKFTYSNPVTITGNQDDGKLTVLPQVDMWEAGCTVYRSDAYAQQFKKWYGADSATREAGLGVDGNPEFKHPEELGIPRPAPALTENITGYMRSNETIKTEER